MPRAEFILVIIFFLSKAVGFGAALPPRLVRSFLAQRASIFRASTPFVVASGREGFDRQEHSIASTSSVLFRFEEAGNQKQIGQRLNPLSMSTTMNGDSGASSSSSGKSGSASTGSKTGVGAGADCPGLDRSKFDSTLELVAIRLPAKLCTSFMNTLKPILFSRARMKRILNVVDDKEKRLLLLHPDVKLDHFKGDLEATGNVTKEHIDFIATNGGEAIRFDLKLGYDNMLVDEVLKAILPPGSEVPSSYEQAGHIAHVNIREDYLAYKSIIGQVILDKNYPQIRTVVNKVGEISNEFRTFPMEVIAGQNELNVTLRETGANFSFNFADVYWNSRLQMEHKRIVDFIRKEHAAASTASGEEGGARAVVVADMMAGVGPFVVPLAMAAPQEHSSNGKAKKKKGENKEKEGKGDAHAQAEGNGAERPPHNKHKVPPMRVFANDLNPMSYAALVNNAKVNKIVHKSIGSVPDVIVDADSVAAAADDKTGPAFRLYNACGRTFLRHLALREGVLPDEVLMNLPASATDFLDALRGLGTLYLDHCRRKMPAGGESEEQIMRRAAAALPRVHVYGFSTASDHVLDMAERACGVMQCELADLGVRDSSRNIASRATSSAGDSTTTTTTTWAGHNVRDVAPKKLMICLSFYVPAKVAFAPFPGSGSDAGASEEPEAKKRKV